MSAGAPSIYAALRQAWSELTAPGAPFEVEVARVRGIPLRTYARAPRTLVDVWSAAGAHGDADYLVYEGDRWTYAQAQRDAAALAGWLAAHGAGPGARVAIAMRNYPEWVLGYWATLATGASVVGMNAWWTTAEMDYALGDAAPVVLVCDEERLERFRATERARAGDAPRVVAVRVAPNESEDATPFAETLAHAPLASIPAIDPDDDACIFYTSGTTGHPKGARLTHRSCVANLWSIAFWNAAQRRVAELRAGADARAGAGAAAAKAGGAPAARPRTVSLVATPLFHVTANNCVLHPATASGAKVVLMYKWDAGRALALVEAERVTALSGVPTMTRELLAHPDAARRDLSSLLVLGGGGSALQPDLVDKIEKSAAKRRPNTGYGLTETSGIITTSMGDFLVAKPASVGPAMPCFETRCVAEDGRVVGPGELGELEVRGAQVVAGYLNRPEATAEAIVDGWFKTGDVAFVDADGFVTIADRKKDMVLRGGENVYCAEVEYAIFDHPDVVECAVFGVPDERLGEEVGAAVVVRKGAALTADAVRAHCAERIAAYKVPRFVWLLDAPLPRNATGKFLKRELRERLAPGDAR
ncbi:MAG: class I adenylate-forming enzyme family protein [Myxococcota bacterium]